MNFEISSTFLNDQHKLKPEDAVAAIILNQEGQVLLQLRDNKNGIFFPNHWGLFGGAVEEGEGPEQTLKRELKEELSIIFDGQQMCQFIRMELGFHAEYRLIKRDFFTVKIENHQIELINLKEGSATRFFTLDESLKIPNFAPYDRYALWVFFNQQRIILD